MPLSDATSLDPIWRVLFERNVGWAFAVALVVAFVLSPVVGRAARRLGAIDMPGEDRRVHSNPTPRLGGVAMALGIMVACALFLTWQVPTLEPVRSQLMLSREQMIATLAGAVLITLLGAVDDIREVSWRIKLAGQVVVAAVAVFGPLALPATDEFGDLVLIVSQLDPPLLPAISLPEPVGAVIPLLAIIALMNMMNFIDGVDGLSAGTGAISAATFTVLAASYNRMNVAILAAAACGAALGFLRHNFHRQGARIFMGDSGSMLLGYLLGVIAIQGVLKTAAAVALVLPLALLAIPILDTMFVVAKRMKYNLPVASADRWHLHHRLLNVGYTPRKVSVMFWIWTGSMSGVALALRFVDYRDGGRWNPEGLALLGVFIAIAFALSLYIVITLEIIKLRHVRERNAMMRARRETERLQGADTAAGSETTGAGADELNGSTA